MMTQRMNKHGVLISHTTEAILVTYQLNAHDHIEASFSSVADMKSSLGTDELDSLSLADLISSEKSSFSISDEGNFLDLP